MRSLQVCVFKRPLHHWVMICCVIFIILVFLHTYKVCTFELNKVFTASRIRRARTNKIVQDGSSKFQVILHTYMRSGSSFTAEILAHNPDVFYVFEPLQPIYYFTKHIDRPYFPYLNSRARIIKYESDTADLFKKTIERYLECQVHDLDLFTLTAYHLRSSNSTLPYKKCTSTQGIVSVLSCLDILKKACLKANTVFMKTIRMDMEIGASFLRVYPKLKFLHLVRDPRATLSSQRKTLEITKGEWTKSLFNVSRKFCETVAKDLDSVQKLQQENPGHVYLLLYEDIAAKPLEKAQIIHDVVGLNFTEEERKIVWTKTSNGSLTNMSHSLNTNKGNSTAAANFWRIHANLTDMQLIDKACGPLLYDKLGFIYIRDEHTLKNLDISLRKNGTVRFL